MQLWVLEIGPASSRGTHCLILIGDGSFQPPALPGSTGPKMDDRVSINDGGLTLRSRVRYLSRGEKGKYPRLLKLIRENYPEHLAEFVFALKTGLRLSSQYSTTYGMIDWTRNVLDLPRTKNDEPVHVGLNDDVMAAISSLPSWQDRKGPIFRNQRHPEKAVRSNDHWFKPALKLARIGGFRWHDLRHTFASWLVQDGVPLDRVSKLLGHKSLTMTMRYAHLAPNQLHEDVAKLTRISTTVAPDVEAQEAISVNYLN